MALLGISKCDHSWEWSTNTELRCTKCQGVDKGHDRSPVSRRCFNCKKDH